MCIYEETVENTTVIGIGPDCYFDLIQANEPENFVPRNGGFRTLGEVLETVVRRLDLMR